MTRLARQIDPLRPIAIDRTMHVRTARDATLLLALCALLFVPAAALRPLTGMEFRTALFVRDMLRDGPSLIPRLDGAPYFDYPPLYFLAAAASSRILGAISPLSLALPSILAGMGTALIAYFAAERRRPGTGLSAGAALATMPLFFSCASQGNVDATLVFFIALAVAGCARAVADHPRGGLAAACVGLAGSALTKGPVGIAVPLFAVALWLLAIGRFRDLACLFAKLCLFLSVFAVLLGGWILAVEGREAIRRLLDAQLLDRVRDEANAPRLYYVWVFLAGFAPWSLPAAARILRGGRPDRPGRERLCVSWFLSTLVLFSLANIKHARYLLPAAPPAAILAAFAWADLHEPGGSPWAPLLSRWIRRACLALLAAGAVCLASAPLFLPVSSPVLAWLAAAACALPIALPVLRRRGGGSGAYLLLVWTTAAGLMAFALLDSPRMASKEKARPFVEAVERAAEGKRIVFYGIRKDGDGLKFLWWRRGNAPLLFVESLPDLRGALSGSAPSVLVAADRERAAVEAALSPPPRLLFEGRLGKRRCIVADVVSNQFRQKMLGNNTRP